MRSSKKWDYDVNVNGVISWRIQAARSNKETNSLDSVQFSFDFPTCSVNGVCVCGAVPLLPQTLGNTSCVLHAFTQISQQMDNNNLVLTFGMLLSKDHHNAFTIDVCRLEYLIHASISIYSMYSIVLVVVSRTYDFIGECILNRMKQSITDGR